MPNEGRGLTAGAPLVARQGKEGLGLALPI